MGNFKLNLDRPHPDSESIRDRQNFDDVLTKFKKTQVPIYKNPWFWGSAGLASVGVATMISLNAFSNNPQKETNDKIITQNTLELPPDTDCLRPPVENEDVPFNTFVVDPKKGAHLELESGTTVDIPANSLKAATEEPVEVKIREFRDKASAFVAGIPMDYEETNAFESAGMIEIRGEQGGEVVGIDPKKAIEVSMNCTQNPADFAFWKLDEKNGKWEEHPTKNQLAASEGQPQEVHALKKEIKKDEQEIKEIKQEISTLKKPLPQEYKVHTPGHQRFDLDFDAAVYPELKALGDLTFEVVPESGYDRNFTQKNWHNVELDKKAGKYFMEFSNGNEVFEIEVRPVLENENLKKAESRFNKAIDNYRDTKVALEQAKKEAEEKKRQHELELKRLMEKHTDLQLSSKMEEENLTSGSIRMKKQRLDVLDATVDFQVTRWGLFNSDRPIAYPEPLAMQPALIWKSNQRVTDFKEVYVFDMTKNARFSYFRNAPTQSIDQLGLSKGSELFILGIDSAGNLGYCQLKRERKGEAIRDLAFEKKSGTENTKDWLKRMLHEDEPAS
ncbi:MAG: hypothetical protein EP338_14080 [Bacteroidetes bacterium]|nr:MAG: hypothetical protein EP338_14080 [Bacteroidota bacterium]